ncbi:MurR/RpiR family transcriptional regulator [Bacillus sp. JCM 19041]|uniref:MurR/RpiR family transcriptional regulator n=1 Tax=Bacillus sp. JCM 19041 TaxID=1460637 RepID=UPI000A6DEE69
MQSSVQTQLTTTERLRLSEKVYDESEEKGVHEIFQDDIANIQSSLEKLDVQAFHQAVELLLASRKVYIVSNRSAKALSVFLNHYLSIFLEDVTLVSSMEEAPELFKKVHENDVAIGISFSRYTSNTINTMKLAKEQGLATIAITDNLLSPLIPYSDVSLTASSQMPNLIDSFVAPLSLINALITYIGRAKQDDFYEYLESLEDIWSEYGIFYTKE